jgi:membrane protein DedA with SNARE-associated domain
MPEGDETVDDAGPEQTDEQRKRRRRRLTMLLTPIVAFQISGIIVGFISPALIKTHPLIVIFFNPINRWLILAVDRVSLPVFFGVSFFRLVLTDPLYFLLGKWYGDGALNWMEEKTGSSGMIPILKKWFARAGALIVFVAPNGYVCLLAGASGMNLGLFVTLNVTGTILRLILIRKTANIAKPVLGPILRFIHRYQWWFVALSIATFAIQYFSNKKKGKGNVELEGVTTMADELEASIEAREAGATEAE